jgi:hypothetical protein
MTSEALTRFAETDRFEVALDAWMKDPSASRRTIVIPQPWR